MMPLIGGNPDAIAIPKHSGRAIKNTKNPANKSLRQFSIRPGRPVLGIASCRIPFVIKIDRSEIILRCIIACEICASSLVWSATRNRQAGFTKFVTRGCPLQGKGWAIKTGNYGLFQPDEV
jgi:hypothetical protein